MNLSALKALQQKVTIEVPDSDPLEVFVKGFSLADITRLFTSHAGTLADLYHNLDAENFDAVLMKIIYTVPSFVEDAILIALGIDYGSEDEQFAKLIPAPKQMEILQLSGKMTFKTEKEVGEFVVAVRSLAAAVASEYSRQQQSNSGSGASDNKSASSKKTATRKRGTTPSA